MRAIPTIAPGVHATPVPGDGVRYHLAATGGPGTVLPARTFVALLLMDGVRTISALHEALVGLGFKLPDPTRTLGLVRTFEAAGIVQVAHHFVTPEALQHSCLGCGRSCEGHLVGPIDDTEAEALQGQLEALRAEDPAAFGPGRDQATRLVRFEGAEKRVLSFPDGRCIFLSDERRCRLHARWGPHAKPLPCRMFPFRMARTEEGTRVAISPRCFKAREAHEARVAAGAEPVPPEALLAEWGVWRVPAVVQGLDGAAPDALGDTEANRAGRMLEARLLRVLQGDAPAGAAGGASTVDVLLGVLAEPDGVSESEVAAPKVGWTPAHRARFAERVRIHCRRVLSEFDVAASPEGGFPGALAALVREGGALRAGDLDDWGGLEADRALSADLRRRLRHLIFARETMLSGGVRAGVTAYLCGVILCAGLAREPSGAVDPARFAERLTTWARITESTEVLDVLMRDDTELDALLSLVPRIRPR